MKPKILVVEGPCGAGKSSAIEAAIVRMPHVAYVDMDLIKQRTFRIESTVQWEHFSSLLGEDWRRRVAGAVGVSWCEQLAALHRPAIVELCDTMQLHSRLDEVFSSRGYRIVQLVLMPSLEDCLERNRRRKDSLPFFDSKVASSYAFYANRLANAKDAIRVLTGTEALFEEIIQQFSAGVAS